MFSWILIKNSDESSIYNSNRAGAVNHPACLNQWSDARVNKKKKRLRDRKKVLKTRPRFNRSGAARRRKQARLAINKSQSCGKKMSSYDATPFTNERCQEKVKRREQTGKKNKSERLWTTVQRTEHDQMSNCCCIFFPSERERKKKKM